MNATMQRVLPNSKGLPFSARLAPVPLRLIVGFGFFMHGFAKLSRGSESFVNVLVALHVPWPYIMAWLTILIELAGGLLVLMGIGVRLAAVPLSAVLLTAIFTVHLRYGFSSIKLLAVTSAGAEFGPPGYECPLLYLACLATLVAGGPGQPSIRNFNRAKQWSKQVC